jgi:hypothetical protein
VELEEEPEPVGARHGFGARRIISGLIDPVFVGLIQLTLFYLTTHLVAQRVGALPARPSWPWAWWSGDGCRLLLFF